MRLLETFRELFEPHQILLHRKSNLGGLVAVEFYEDLVALGKSAKLPPRIAAHDRVINLRNITIGKTARRGDGTMGELVPSAIAIVEKDFVVARGPTLTLKSALKRRF